MVLVDALMGHQEEVRHRRLAEETRFLEGIIRAEGRTGLVEEDQALAASHQAAEETEEKDDAVTKVPQVSHYW